MNSFAHIIEEGQPSSGEKAGISGKESIITNSFAHINEEGQPSSGGKAGIQLIPLLGICVFLGEGEEAFLGSLPFSSPFHCSKCSLGPQIPESQPPGSCHGGCVASSDGSLHSNHPVCQKWDCTSKMVANGK